MFKSQFMEQFAVLINDDTKCSTIEKVCTLFSDGDWIESKDQSDDGIRLIQTGNVGNGVYLDKGERARFIDESTFERLHCTEVLPNDILISRLTVLGHRRMMKSCLFLIKTTRSPHRLCINWVSFPSANIRT